MALIPCPECGRMVSPNAEECPNCGAPVKQLLVGRTINSHPAEESNSLLSENNSASDKKENTSDVSQGISSAKKNKNSNLSWILVSAIVIALAIGAFIVYHYRIGDGYSQKDQYYKTNEYTLKENQLVTDNTTTPEEAACDEISSEIEAEELQTVLEEYDNQHTENSYYDNEPYLIDFHDNGTASAKDHYLKLREFKVYMNESTGDLYPVVSFYNGSEDTVSSMFIEYKILTNRSRLGEKKYSYCNLIDKGSHYESKSKRTGSFEIFPGQTWSSDGGFKFRDVSQRSGSRVDNPDEVIGVQIVEVEAIIMNVAAIKLSGYPKNIRIIRF